MVHFCPADCLSMDWTKNLQPFFTLTSHLAAVELLTWGWTLTTVNSASVYECRMSRIGTFYRQRKTRMAHMTYDSNIENCLSAISLFLSESCSQQLCEWLLGRKTLSSELYGVIQGTMWSNKILCECGLWMSAASGVLEWGDSRLHRHTLWSEAAH